MTSIEAVLNNVEGIIQGDSRLKSVPGFSSDGQVKAATNYAAVVMSLYWNEWQRHVVEAHTATVSRLASDFYGFCDAPTRTYIDTRLPERRGFVMVDPAPTMNPDANRYIWLLRSKVGADWVNKIGADVEFNRGGSYKDLADEAKTVLEALHRSSRKS